MRWTERDGVTVLADGFKRPAGVLLEPDGSLLVAAECHGHSGTRKLGGLFRVGASGQVGANVIATANAG